MLKYVKEFSFLPLSWRLLWATLFGKYSLFLISFRINWEHGFLFTESGHPIWNMFMAWKHEYMKFKRTLSSRKNAKFIFQQETRERAMCKANCWCNYEMLHSEFAVECVSFDRWLIPTASYTFIPGCHVVTDKTYSVRQQWNLLTLNYSKNSKGAMYTITQLM
jgi:hypothetical protein